MEKMIIKKLIKEALEVKKKAYCPYSHFHVGAALLCDDGTIITGCNIESAAYSPTICAERAAISKAISEGKKGFKAICVVGDNERTFPCGVCRQTLREFSAEMLFIIAAEEDSYDLYTMEDLLPHSFGPEDLKKEEKKNDK